MNQTVAKECIEKLDSYLESIARRDNSPRHLYVKALLEYLKKVKFNSSYNNDSINVHADELYEIALKYVKNDELRLSKENRTTIIKNAFNEFNDPKNHYGFTFLKTSENCKFKLSKVAPTPELSDTIQTINYEFRPINTLFIPEDGRQNDILIKLLAFGAPCLMLILLIPMIVFFLGISLSSSILLKIGIIGMLVLFVPIILSWCFFHPYYYAFKNHYSTYFLWTMKDDLSTLLHFELELKHSEKPRKKRLFVSNLSGVCPICKSMVLIEKDTRKENKLIGLIKILFESSNLIGVCSGDKAHRYAFDFLNKNGSRIN
jgi:hypothetical protein